RADRLVAKYVRLTGRGWFLARRVAEPRDREGDIRSPCEVVAAVAGAVRAAPDRDIGGVASHLVGQAEIAGVDVGEVAIRHMEEVEAGTRLARNGIDRPSDALPVQLVDALCDPACEGIELRAEPGELVVEK